MARRFSFRWMVVAAAAGSAVMATAGTPVRTQETFCAEHDELAGRLAELFQEKQIAYGVVGAFAIMEIYVSAAGTWTMVMTDVADKSCIMAAGEGWEPFATAMNKDRRLDRRLDR